MPAAALPLVGTAVGCLPATCLCCCCHQTHPVRTVGWQKRKQLSAHVATLCTQLCTADSLPLAKTSVRDCNQFSCLINKHLAKKTALNAAQTFSRPACWINSPGLASFSSSSVWRRWTLIFPTCLYEPTESGRWMVCLCWAILFEGWSPLQNPSHKDSVHLSPFSSSSSGLQSRPLAVQDIKKEKKKKKNKRVFKRNSSKVQLI